MGEKRVIAQVASNVVHNDDWFLKDSPTQDTSKISATNLKAILGADGTQALSKEDNAIAEDYDSTSTYNKDDFAFYENKLYRCLANNTTGTWDGTKWEEFDLPTVLIATAHNIETAEFTIGTYYSADDLVLKDGKLYQCVVGHNATEWKSQFWRSVTIDEMLGYLSDSIAPEHNPSTVYAVGDLVMHNKALWRCIQAGAGAFVNANWEEVTVSALIAEAGQIDDVQVKTTGDYETVVENKIAKIDLSGKADTSGYYENFIAGTAENLMADNYTEDKVPYNFRQSFNGARLEDEIVGGTVAWNQLVQSSSGIISPQTYGNITFTKTASPLSWSFSGIADGRVQSNNLYDRFYTITGHKYGIIINKDISPFTLRENNGSLPQTSVSAVFNCTEGKNTYLTFDSRIDISGTTVNLQDVKVSIIDLTQMFGSTIADYIYSLEQATAGSGIAWLKSYGFLTKDYYAYQSGKLESVNVSSRKIVGKNLFDIHIDKDTLLTTITLAQPINQPITISAVDNNITVNDNVWRITITLKDGTTVRIGEQGFWGGTFPKTINGSDANPIVSILYRGENITSGSYDVQVELGSTPTSYEPYKSKTYPLDSDLTLRGIVKKDANNKLYYDGDIYESDGSVTRRYGVLDLSTLSWTVHNGVSMKASLPTVKIATSGVIPNIISTNYKSSLAIDITSEAEKNGIGISTVEHTIFVSGQSAGTGYLVYELATPTSETADAFATPQIVNPKGTEEYVDYAESQGTRDVAIPVGHNSKYYADLKAKIEDIPDVPSANGTYTLKATRSASGVTYNWISG